MKFELTLLKKPIEVELSTKNRTLPILIIGGGSTLIFMVFNLLTDFYDQGITMTIALILLIPMFYFLYKTPNKNEEGILKSNRIGQLLFDDGIVLETTNGITKIGKDFGGTIFFDYGGYNGEVEGLLIGHQNQYYGTNNKIVFIEENQETTFYIFIDGLKESEYYFKMIYWAYENGIKVKERYRKEKRYGGKQMSYQEVQAFKEKYGIRE